MDPQRHQHRLKNATAFFECLMIIYPYSRFVKLFFKIFSFSIISIIFTLITNLFIGLSIGTNVIVAKDFGAKNEKELNIYIGSDLGFCSSFNFDVMSYLKEDDDIFFLEEFTNNKYINVFFVSHTIFVVTTFLFFLRRGKRTNIFFE